jgi:hypothetical protein
VFYDLGTNDAPTVPPLSRRAEWRPRKPLAVTFRARAAGAVRAF